MSMERDRNDPIIAERMERFRRKQEEVNALQVTSSQIEFPNQPIEKVASLVLKELEVVRKGISRNEDDKFDDSPLTAVYKNFLFINDYIKSPNVEELLRRTHAKIFFDKNKSLYFGLLPEIPDEAQEDRDKGLYLCFDDGQNTHPLIDPATFQEVWDRADRKGKSLMVKFGRLLRKQIIKTFENSAKTNITFF